MEFFSPVATFKILQTENLSDVRIDGLVVKVSFRLPIPRTTKIFVCKARLGEGVFGFCVRYCATFLDFFHFPVFCDPIGSPFGGDHMGSRALGFRYTFFLNFGFLMFSVGEKRLSRVSRCPVVPSGYFWLCEIDSFVNDRSQAFLEEYFFSLRRDVDLGRSRLVWFFKRIFCTFIVIWSCFVSCSM